MLSANLALWLQNRFDIAQKMNDQETALRTCSQIEKRRHRVQQLKTVIFCLSLRQLSKYQSQSRSKVSYNISMQQQSKSKKYQPHFPVTKIKKIIQQNQQIGKVSNLVPPLIQKSLQFFLIDLIKKSEEVALEHGVNKLTPAVLKHALLELQSYEFMKDALDDVDDTIISLAASKSKSSQKGLKRTKSEAQNKETMKQEKKGRKKVKEQLSQEQQNSEDEDN